MKSLRKKIREIKRNSNFKVLFLIVAMTSSLFMFTGMLGIPTQIQSDSEETGNETKTPTMSAPDWVSATKLWFAGTQSGSYDENNLRTDDSVSDITNFEIDDSQTWHTDYATIIKGGRGALWGTFPPRIVGGNVYDGLKNDDNVYLFLEAPWLGGWTPGLLWLRWGDYPAPSMGIRRATHRIRIDWEIMCEAGLPPNILNLGNSLILTAICDDGTFDSYPITDEFTCPTNGHHYTDVWEITSGPVFNRVTNEGGYIKEMQMQMINLEAGLLVISWMNVDYIDIYYDYYDYKVDFYYNLDFGGYGLGTVTKFDLKIDLMEAVLLLELWLFDYVTSSWDFKRYINFAGMKTLTVDSEADHYFSGLKKMSVRFRKLDYLRGDPWTDYQISIDLIRLDIPPPDPPGNIDVNQGIEHVFLTWGTANSYGAPVLHYNVYRGTTPGGAKSVIGTPSVTEFNDTTGTPGTLYYYQISATSIAGESLRSDEFSGRPYDKPFVEWLSPANESTVIFPYNASDPTLEWIMFNFDYDWTELHDITLEIAGNDFGSVFDTNKVRLYPYYLTLEPGGPVTAILRGFRNAVEVDNDTIYITFIRTLDEAEVTIDLGAKILGNRLYLIFHDPNGDQSYSSFNESSSSSIGATHEITSIDAEKIEFEMSTDLFGLGAGVSTQVTINETLKEGYDFRLELSDISTLTSNQESDDADYIGPGNGDMYWGEAWTFNWVLNATWREFSDGTDRNEDPEVFYGIIRGAEILVNDASAPSSWKNMNPVYNSWANVIWLEELSITEDKAYIGNYNVSETINRTETFTIDFNPTAAASVGINSQITIMETKHNYREPGLDQIHEVSYHIDDDEHNDYFVQGVGIDEVFGTYIFNTSVLCRTSEPFEHNTIDYIPPVIGNPSIDYDSNDDDQGPCFDDTPIITVDLSDESGIKDAKIIYSIDNGTSWSSVSLTEQVGNPGTWETSIPAQAENTTVLWYVVVWDNFNLNTTRDDYNAEKPFEYKVVRKIPEIPKDVPPDIPGYPIIALILFGVTSMIAVVIIYHRKYRKSLKK